MQMRVLIIGAGVAGLTCAVELAERGAVITVIERAATLGGGNCSWCAGGMLAPWCELAGGAEPIILQLGMQSIAWWRERFPGLRCEGTLVIAKGRDASELEQFARRAQHFQRLSGKALGALEPDLAGRFTDALYFPDEGHLDPRLALCFLASRLRELGGEIRFGTTFNDADFTGLRIVDCRGLAARDVLPDLRGVKGEMLLLRSREMTLRRPIRFLHPRVPVYIVPRGDGLYMVGATLIENDEHDKVAVRSALELLSAAYAVHPAFGEAQILEIGAQARPAFFDNRPRIRRRGDAFYINGLYRHGFLVAPALATRIADALLHDRHDPEVMDEDSSERRLA